jgi:arylformamidase
MIDITMTLKKDMAVYKNQLYRQPIIVSQFKDNLFQSKMTLDLHSGTHVDYPLHTIDGGKSALDYQVDAYMGRCYVKDCTYLNHRILKRDLQAIHISTYDFILFKTKNSSEETYNHEFVYLSEEAANYLADFNLKGVGIDGLSVEREQEGHPTHHALLGKEILIYEGLDLSEVEEGVYEFVGLPLKIEKAEAAPVRCILR